MRLIDVKTLELKEFFDDNVPRYAILSHTWGQEEVSFQDLCWLNDYENKRLEPTSLPALISRTHKRRKEKVTAICRRSGFEKIVQSARLAEEKRLRYLWVDTCCIDKSSSSELSEAINSMFRWYERSTVCFAFLSDVRRRARTRDLFEDSRWFTRGWTLQELIAPRKVLFYDKSWAFIESKKSFSTKIQRITGIPIKDLDTLPLSSFAVAVRLGWARKRNTSRKEDMAYCLMGIFNINMPLLYGEGEDAFIRLQKEILKEHRGHSLLAWGYNESILIRSTIFAPSPSYFGNLNMVERWSDEPFHLNNKGLEISLRIFQLPNVGVGSIPDRYDVHYAVWEVHIHPQLGFKGLSTRHLCFPLLASSSGSKGTNYEQQMIRPPSRPVVINAGRIPEGTAHRRVLILGPRVLDFFRNNFLRVRIQLADLYKFIPSARLVEVFPPAADLESEPIPGAFGLSVGANRHYGTHIFRFLVPENIGSANMEGGRSMHFAVILGPYSAAAASETTWGKPGPEVIVSAIEWMDHPKSPDARKSDKLQEEAKRFWSLVDAFMAGVSLLDAKMWFDKQLPFLVGGRPLLAATTLKSGGFFYKDRPEITDVGFSLGKGNNQVDTR